MSADEEITVRELKDRFDRGERPTLIDVREPYEVEIAAIPYSLLIPQNEIPDRYHELNPDDEVVLMGLRAQYPGAAFVSAISREGIQELREESVRRLLSEHGVELFERDRDEIGVRHPCAVETPARFPFLVVPHRSDRPLVHLGVPT